MWDEGESGSFCLSRSVDSRLEVEWLVKGIFHDYCPSQPDAFWKASPTALRILLFEVFFVDRMILFSYFFNDER